MDLAHGMGALSVAGRTLTLRDAHHEYRVTLENGTARVHDGPPVAASVRADGAICLATDPPAIAWTAAHGDVRWVFLDGDVFRFEIERESRRRRAGAHHGSLSAPMPATVVRVLVAPGDTVARGDTLIILEAMKMELPVKAGAEGTVTAVHCRAGELVQPGATLIELDEAEV